MRNLIRVISAGSKLGGVPVLRTPEDRFRGLTLVDVFHPPTIASLRQRAASRIPAGAWPDGPPGSTRWLFGLRRVLPGLDAVALVDERRAGAGLMTSFLSALRGIFQARDEQEQTQVGCGADFTVNSSPGYALESFEECRYAPLVFGDRRSSPVTDRLQCGFYKFQATKDGTTIVDGGTHRVSPTRRSTLLRDV
jgi:hypothetical protein